MLRKTVVFLAMTLIGVVLQGISDKAGGEDKGDIPDAVVAFLNNAPHEIYTIQTGSFLEQERAHRQFDAIYSIVSGKEFSFLRIEKIGKYYSVRLGRFNDYQAAEQFIISISPKLSHADILQVYIKPERLIRLEAGTIPELHETGSPSADQPVLAVKNELYLRQILVASRAEAEDIMHRLAEGERFEEIAVRESKGPNAFAGGYMGRVDPSNLHPAIAEAVLSEGIASDPVIVSTERGYHIVQRIILSDEREAHELMNTAQNTAASQAGPMEQDNIRSFKAFVRRNPLYSEAYYNLGVYYSRSGEYQKAVEAYMGAIIRNPYHQKAYVNLGVAYSRLRMYGNAIESFKQAVNLAPDDVNAHINLGIALGHTGMYTIAIKVLKRATELDARNAEAHYNLGFAYLTTENRDSALAEYRILKDLNTLLANRLIEEINQ